MRSRQWMAVAAMGLALCLAPVSLRAAEADIEGKALKTSTSQKGLEPDGYWPRVILSLAAIAGLIFLARHLLRRAGNSSRFLGRCQAMEVLARSPISMKHQMVLVRLASRVLLVGVGPAGMNTLCELTDAREIAQVLDQLHKGGGDEFLKKLQDKSAEFSQAAGGDAQSPGSLRRLSDKLQNELREEGR